ncbi:MAG: hypothetical protein ACREJD_05775 [Phycisphaerales bacterium]
MRIQLFSAKRAESKPGSDSTNFLAMVSFGWQPEGMDRLKVTRDFKDGDEWKTSTIAELDGVSMVRVNSAFLKKSAKGEFYIQVQSLDLPWEVSKAVAQLAIAKLKEDRAAAPADGRKVVTGVPGSAPLGEDDIPF